MKAKRLLGQIVLDSLEGRTTIATGSTYEELYKRVCKEWGSRLSRRDFQKQLDNHCQDNLVAVDLDPKDRRKKRIYLKTGSPSNPYDFDTVLAWRLREFLTKLFTLEPWLMPVVVWGTEPNWKWNDLIHVGEVTVLRRKLSKWQKYTDKELKEITSIDRASFWPLLEKFGGPGYLFEKQQQALEVMIKTNVEEITDAWAGRRVVDRSKVFRALRIELFKLARETLGQTQV